jgi:DNA processing protein
VVIVSGLAYGIDAIAHKAAVQTNLPTVGVLAHGMDKIYPSQHKSLAKQMLLNGGLLTEFRKDAKSAGCNNLIRNNKAMLLTNASQLIEVLGWEQKKPKAKQQKQLFLSLTPDEKILVDILKEKEVVHIDELYLKSGLNSSSVAASMLSLEFENVLISLPGKMYKLA